MSVFIVHWVHTDLKTQFIYNNPNGIIPMHLHVLNIVCGYCNSLDHNPSSFNLSNFQWSIYMYVDINVHKMSLLWMQKINEYYEMFFFFKIYFKLISFTFLEENCKIDFWLKNLQVILSCIKRFWSNSNFSVFIIYIYYYCSMYFY